MSPERSRRATLMAGVFFTVMGVLFLLDQFDVFELDLTLVLPVLLVVLGLVVLLGGGRPREEPAAESPSRPNQSGPGSEQGRHRGIARG